MLGSTLLARVSSPFLEKPPSDWIASNELAFAIKDGHPVSDGHALVIPRRIIATWFDATAEERAAIFELVDEVKRRLDVEHRPDGYNIGINAGEAAGQTVPHLHVHVIPRYRGDVPDPRGGVRHVIPGKGNYLASKPHPLATGGAEDPFFRHVEPLFGIATDIAILAAFVQESGLDQIEWHVREAMARGAKVRLITGDYLHITQATALMDLLDWVAGSAAVAAAPGPAEEATPAGSLQVRVVETEKLPTESRSFHPKSWRFEGPALGTAFVGSSNLSRSALRSGIEWNLRVDRHSDPEAYQAVVTGFEQWWSRALPLTSEWVEAYSQRARQAARPLPLGEEEPAPVAPPPEPHEVQREALEELHRCRQEQGWGRALVVLATGLGKTYLAALDVVAWSKAQGRMPRVLVLAHREEILLQAAKTFRRLLRERAPRFGWFAGNLAELDGNVVFASVQKLSRPEHLARLDRRSFDYVVVDEVHHGTAPTYRAIFDHLEPRFLLGLTATPERADGGDILGLFDDHVAYEVDLGEGIARDLLAPFAYYGLRDDTDYRKITFRNRRFDPAELERAIDTDGRMQTMWEAWTKHPGARTLVFCCSIRHAEHASTFLTERGVVAVAVHSGPGSAPRDKALEELASGALQAVCVVDLFNEGVDLPDVDRVVMLRPTESPVVFLQQLGRGLRRSAGKQRLMVLDFVGNHRIFLDRVRMLLSLVGQSADLRTFIEDDAPALRLPFGHPVHIELEAKDLLRSLLPKRGKSEVERVYLELRAARGERPTAGELHRMGYRPSTLRTPDLGWFDFVYAQESQRTELDEAAKLALDEQRRALDVAGEWIRHLEITPMTKSYKMVTLEALVEGGALFDGLPVVEIARRSRVILGRSPDLELDLGKQSSLLEPGPDKERRFEMYWREYPIHHWTTGPGRRWFALEEDRLVPKIPCSLDARQALTDMTRELIDYRLTEYRARKRAQDTSASFLAKVIWNQRDPILKLPPRSKNPERQKGEIDIRLPNGDAWRFRFNDEFCNVARPVGSQRNELPDLMRRWFGIVAGRPGTAFHVRFTRSPDGMWVEPDRDEAHVEAPRGLLLAFPTLRAAAGTASEPMDLSPEAEHVRLPTKERGEGLFAVRATGDSMDGGKRPIRDGDWLVMRFARGITAAELDGRVALLQVPDAVFGVSYQVKRVVRDGGGWWLRSDNPLRPSYEATSEVTAIAILVDVVRPESIGPRPGEKLSDADAAAAFGLAKPLCTGRIDGQLFLCVDKPGALVVPDRLRCHVEDRRPSETAFVLTRASTELVWRYAGVGRYLESEDEWVIPAVDFETYRALGKGRGASRSLPVEALERAEAVVKELLRNPGVGQFVERDGRRCRIAGAARDGGLRVDGGPGGFAERTVSLADIGWVVVASDDVAQAGGVLDERRVNRLRYIDGTPKSATRWIDTGWALTLVAAAHVL